MTALMTITSKGQVTFPKSLLQLVGAKRGDKLLARVDRGKVIIEPMGGSILDLVGKLPPLKLPQGKTVTQLINQARDDLLTPTVR